MVFLVETLFLVSDPDLVLTARLVPVMTLAADTGLGELVENHLRLPGYLGADAEAKTTALVAGMDAGADCIDDMGILRHGGRHKLFTGAYAPSKRGRSFGPSVSATPSRAPGTATPGSARSTR